MTPMLEHLSPREEEVLAMIAEGFGLREIGARLGISWRTARNHRNNARGKLGASTTPQAVAIFIAAKAGVLA